MTAADGILVVDKPADWTSHDVVARCRRLAATRRVGHAGTLDPAATGVLVVGIGRATRLLGHLAAGTKAYDAVIRLGASTLTDDAEGELLSEADASGLDPATVEAEVECLTGDLLQVPSAVSAVKIKGERAYARVRGGKTVELEPRPVRVDEFSLTGLHRNDPYLDLDVHVECSSGTYVRALARDLGARLGVGGHLRSLRRTRVGLFGLEQASRLDELEQLEPGRLPVLPLDDVAAASFHTYVVADDEVTGVRNGRPLHARLSAEPGEGPVAMLSPAGRFLALYEQHGPVAKAVAVFLPASVDRSHS